MSNVPPPLHTHRELGKVATGKLVVITPDRQDVFLVKGRQPAYVPPQPSALPSGAYLTGTTANSRAKGSSSSQKSLRAGAQADMQQAAGSSGSAGDGSQQQRSRVNYLQQNIRRAAAASSSKAKKTDRRV